MDVIKISRWHCIFLPSFFQSKLQRGLVWHALLGMISSHIFKVKIQTNKAGLLRIKEHFQVGQPKCRGKFSKSA